VDPSAPLAKPLFLKPKEERGKKRKKAGLFDLRRRAYTLPLITALRRKCLRSSFAIKPFLSLEDANGVLLAISVF
jgi:hypothetical protein